MKSHDNHHNYITFQRNFEKFMFVYVYKIYVFKKSLTLIKNYCFMCLLRKEYIIYIIVTNVSKLSCVTPLGKT